MMKITWIDTSEREIPYVGIMKPGKAYTVKDGLAKSLIKQGQAEKYKKPKTNKAG